METMLKYDTQIQTGSFGFFEDLAGDVEQCLKHQTTKLKDNYPLENTKK